MENRNPNFQEVQLDEEKIPTFQEVQSFFNDEYAFIKKWLAVKEPNWDEVIDEARQLEQKHPFRYCANRLVSTVDLIEKTYMESQQTNQATTPRKEV